MLLKAAFWIGVVAVLMPHEPDLGLERQALASSVLRPAEEIPALNVPACRDNSRSCSVSGDFIASFRSIAVASLAGVKADLEAQKRTQMPHNVQTD